MTVVASSLNGAVIECPVPSQALAGPDIVSETVALDTEQGAELMAMSMPKPAIDTEGILRNYLSTPEKRAGLAAYVESTPAEQLEYEAGHEGAKLLRKLAQEEQMLLQADQVLNHCTEFLLNSLLPDSSLTYGILNQMVDDWRDLPQTFSALSRQRARGSEPQAEIFELLQPLTDAFREMLQQAGAVAYERLGLENKDLSNADRSFLKQHFSAVVYAAVTYLESRHTAGAKRMRVLDIDLESHPGAAQARGGEDAEVNVAA